ncbi:MAG: metallophosphoesterase [Ardenticatenaceae bacterium]|nr:metallophosphoesterase [Ardenticatenaceae bacterium]
MVELERGEEPEDLLKEGNLHKVMVVFATCDTWPGWAVMLLALGWAVLTGALWQWLLGDVLVAGWVTAVFLLTLFLDMFILITLPKRGLSFGPWKSQFAVLGLPRTIAAILLAFVGFVIGAWPAFALFLLVQLTGTAAFIWGALIEPFRVGLSQLTIYTDRLPADAAPIRLLHVSDLHIERLTKREEKILALARGANPDFIVITGDYVNLSYNKDPLTHRQVHDYLQKFNAPYGVYATLGSMTVDLRDQVVPIFDGLNIPLMRQGWQVLELGNGRSLVILGMDCTHHLPTDRTRLAQLHAAAPNSVPQILLYHSPEIMPEAAQHGIDLYLCGHTHGGQVRLPFIGALLTSSQLGRRYVMGHYQEGRTNLYVSRGLGLEGMSAPRVRFLAPPEMTLVTIRGKNKES